jgi:FkbM family methyltransferase
VESQLRQQSQNLSHGSHRDHTRANDGEAAHSRRTFSIEAEDLLVERVFYSLLERSQNYLGFYVDIGAFDPITCSNTWHFYKRGWRGLTIEANPERATRFRELRPRDIHVNAAVGAEGLGRYLQFSDPLLNGFLTDDMIAHHQANGFSVARSDMVSIRPIESLLCENVPSDTPIDYLNIDVELMEDEILSHWDFSRWMPRIIAIEIHGGLDVTDIAATHVARLLANKGYVFFSRLWHSSIFVLRVSILT